MNKSSSSSNNNTVNRFVMLTGSDTTATLLTGILLLLCMTSKYNNTSIETTTKCTKIQLVMRLSTYLLPILNGLISIPVWMYHLYNCTDCNDYEDNGEEPKKNVFNSKYNKRKTMITIIIQWLIPIVSILSTLLVKPETLKISKQQPTINEIETLPMLMLNMGEILCEDMLNLTAIKMERNTREQKLLNDENISSTILKQIYNIVKQQIPENNTNMNTTRNTQSTPQSVKHIEQDSFVQLMNKTNVLELMKNYTKQNNENEVVTELPTSSTNYQCYITCQLSKSFLKNLFFLILFINFFTPLIITAVLRAMTYKNIQMMEIKNQIGVEQKRIFSKVLERKTIIGAMTLSPTLMETTIRTLLSIKIPENVSSVLLITAMVGTVIRNVSGLYLVNLIHNSNVAIHPTVSSQTLTNLADGTLVVADVTTDGENRDQQDNKKIYIQDIENQPNNQFRQIIVYSKLSGSEDTEVNDKDVTDS
ncbi:uncharacterized protein LOC142319807 [Lycorma delicatula]|uniref:uncharacterized protein LOC142319807 n=1 Tax=Lycorma delicatula TaxID=130591 RepID=UPI003F5170A5